MEQPGTIIIEHAVSFRTVTADTTFDQLHAQIREETGLEAHLLMQVGPTRNHCCWINALDPDYPVDSFKDKLPPADHYHCYYRLEQPAQAAA